MLEMMKMEEVKRNLPEEKVEVKEKEQTAQERDLRKEDKKVG
jgi:hypothetical protein